MRHFPYGAPTLRGRFKSRPEDFVVVETLGFEPDGHGEHLFIFVEKTGLATPQLIECVARDFGCRSRDIGYSGLKDKQGITRQWLSLPHSVATPNGLPVGDGYRVLLHARHRRKLRPGTHKSNRFEVCLREVAEFTAAGRAQLQCIEQRGFANYFGEQRFGRQRDNVAQALASLSASRLPRWRRSLLLSALRSHLFNRILSRRVESGRWLQPIEGDVFMLRGSRSIFTETPDSELLRRFESLDISPTASLYGSGRCLLSGRALGIENEIFAAEPEMTRCLDRHRAKRQMRPLRVAPSEMRYDYDAATQTLKLSASLPAGSYLSSLLDHFLERIETD